MKIFYKILIDFIQTGIKFDTNPGVASTWFEQLGSGSFLRCYLYPKQNDMTYLNSGRKEKEYKGICMIIFDDRRGRLGTNTPQFGTFAILKAF